MKQKKMKPAAMTATQRLSAAKATLLPMLSAAMTALPTLSAAMTATLPMPAKTAPQRLSAAKAVHLIILLAALPLLLATSCRDRDDEPTAGPGKLITVTRLNVSIDAMHSAAEMNAARSTTRTGNGGDIGNNEITRADALTPDENGYVCAEKKNFVPGDVLHFMVALTEEDFDLKQMQVVNATLQNDCITWHFDHPLVLPQEAANIFSLQVFYDKEKTPYDSYYSAHTAYNNATDGTLIAPDDNSYSYPDLLSVYGEKDHSGNFKLQNGTITIGPNGTLIIGLKHQNSLVQISDVNIQLGNAKVSSIKANIAYNDLDAPDYYTVPLTSISNGTSWGAIIGYAPLGGGGFLQSFIVSLDNGSTVSVRVPKGSNFPIDGRLLSSGQSYSYRLLLLPGSITAQEDAGTAPSYKVRRDPAVPAGYIPIYTKDDLRKIGQKGSDDKYLPAIVNNYLYTNASSAILAKDAQKDPIIYDIVKGIYTDSGYSEEATNAAIASGGIAPGADPTSDGSGTVGPLTFSLSARYILMNDIDLTPESGAIPKDLTGIDDLKTNHPEELWKPIGDINTPFTGRFHGNGFTIRGMTINGDANVLYLGLFGRTEGAVIYNVHMKDARVKGTRSPGYFGSLVGCCDHSTISSCSATGCALQGTELIAIIGGLVGSNESGTITRSHATACALSGVIGLRAGGLVGYNNGILASCYTAGCTASCTDNNISLGGLVGWNSATIYGCYATYAQKSGDGDGYFGSLVGFNNGGATIASSYAINATGSTLGLVGTNYDSTITACVSPFQNAGSTGATSGSDGQDAGGGSYWEVISDGNSPTGHSGGYAPLTSAGNLADVRTLLVNNTGQDITTDMGGGDNGNPLGSLGKIPPGGLYTEKRTWTAIGIWGGYTTPGGPTVTLPRIDWTYDGKEKD